MRSMESARHMMPPNDDKGKESKPKFDLEEVSQDVASELPGAEDVDAAFENMTTGELEQTPADKLPSLYEEMKGTVESKPKMVPDAIALNEAMRVSEALMKGESKGLAAVKDSFLERIRESDPNVDEAAALAMLDAKLKEQHDIYFELNKTELASEIDAFRRSLESASEAKTAGGKAYLAKLEGGGFPSLEEAINALDGLAKGAKTEDEQAAMNAEFNVLFAAAQEKFSKGGSAGEAGSLEDVTDAEVDDLFGNLEAGTETKAKTGLEDVKDEEIDDLFDNIQKTGTE
jgi:hypothetical protein